MTEIGVIADYAFDDSDWAAVEYGVRGTNPELDIWFEYPVGRLTAKLGSEDGHTLVQVLGEQESDRPRLTWMTHIMQNWHLSDQHPD